MNRALLDASEQEPDPTERESAGIPSSSLTASQRERRRRIIDAVLELAEEGGYDAVQLREVARIADASLRTIYKYFGSRDELLIASMLQWRMDVAVRSAATVTGDDFVERVLSLHRHNFEAFSKHPRLFETFVHVQVKAGDRVLWGRDTMDAVLDEELAGFDPDFASDFRMILLKVVYADYIQCANGHMTLDEAWAHTERTIRRLGECAPPRTAN